MIRSLLENALREKKFYKEAIRVELISPTEQINGFDDWLKWDPISSGEGDLLHLPKLRRTIILYQIRSHEKGDLGDEESGSLMDCLSPQPDDILQQLQSDEISSYVDVSELVNAYFSSMSEQKRWPQLPLFGNISKVLSSMQMLQMTLRNLLLLGEAYEGVLGIDDGEMA
ncbi:hypothetical protein Tco_0460932 [Tanacetum coccineum]